MCSVLLPSAALTAVLHQTRKQSGQTALCGFYCSKQCAYTISKQVCVCVFTPNRVQSVSWWRFTLMFETFSTSNTTTESVRVCVFFPDFTFLTLVSLFVWALCEACRVTEHSTVDVVMERQSQKTCRDEALKWQEQWNRAAKWHKWCFNVMRLT